MSPQINYVLSPRLSLIWINQQTKEIKTKCACMHTHESRALFAVGYRYTSKIIKLDKIADGTCMVIRNLAIASSILPHMCSIQAGQLSICTYLFISSGLINDAI